MLDARKARGINARIGFVFGDQHYVARLKKGTIKVARGDLADCDLIFTGPPALLAAVVYGGQPLDLIGVDGDRKLAEKFVTLFPLPAKVGDEGH